MPKMTRPDNRVRSRRKRTSQSRKSLHIPSIGELLAKGFRPPPTVTQDTELQRLLLELKDLAGVEIAGHITSLTRRENGLLVWVDNASWSARARYLLLPGLAGLQPRYPWLTEISVRVLRTPARSEV